MAVIWIPSQLREVTGGLETVTVEAETVRQAVERLEERFPGIRGRLCEGDRLRQNLSLVVDGMISRKQLREHLTASSEVHFLPAISGG